MGVPDMCTACTSLVSMRLESAALSQQLRQQLIDFGTGPLRVLLVLHYPAVSLARSLAQITEGGDQRLYGQRDI